MHRATDVVTGELGEVQCLGDHALPGERGVAVDEHGQHAVVRGVAQAVLLRPRHSFGHGIDGFEMARVRGEGDADRRTRSRGELPGRAHVVLHVARTLRHARIELALELAEDLLVRLADDVGEHVQAAAVRHRHHDLFHAGVGRAVEEELEHRDQRLRAFEAEALLTQELRVQEAFERLGAVQGRQDAALVVE